MQRDVLAVTVTRDHVRFDAAGVEQLEQTDADCANRRLRDVGIGERTAARLVLVGRERRRRINVFAEGARESSVEHAIERGHRVAHFAEVHGEITQHARRLRTLAGEQEHHLAALGALC